MGTVQRTENFSVWSHDAGMNIKPGHSGEETKIDLYAKNSSGKEVYFRIEKHTPSVEGYNIETVDEFNVCINSDPWSYNTAYTLKKGNYAAGFEIDGRWEAWKEFSVVDKGAHQPRQYNRLMILWLIVLLV